MHAGECVLHEYTVDPVIALAGRHGVPCLIGFAGNLGAAERLLCGFPQTTIIIAHMDRCRHRGNHPALANVLHALR